MAVQIFKDGADMLVAPEYLTSYLDGGWSVEDPNYKGPRPPETFYPPHLRHIERLPEAEADATILKEMGITEQPKKRGRPKRAN